MPREKKGPEWVPAGYRFDAEQNCLTRLKSADEALPEAVYPEGSADGYPQALYHDGQRCLGHFGPDWTFKAHGVPEGFGFREGVLVQKDADAPAQVVGTAEQPSSIPGVIVANAAGTPGEAPAVTAAAEKER